MTRCEPYEIEIAAAGGGALPAAVEAHLAWCPGCASLRSSTLALAGAGDGGSRLTPGAAVAMARSALAGRARRPVLWAVPLLSASASAAALILYFGLAAPAGSSAASQPGQDVPALAPALPEAQQLTLPDSLQAVRDLMLTGTRDDEEVDKS